MTINPDPHKQDLNASLETLKEKLSFFKECQLHYSPFVAISEPVAEWLPFVNKRVVELELLIASRL
jgi:hypothetical protein